MNQILAIDEVSEIIKKELSKERNDNVKRKWVAETRQSFQQRVSLVSEETIYPKMSHVIICKSLEFEPMMGLVTQHFAGGQIQRGYKRITLTAG